MSLVCLVLVAVYRTVEAFFFKTAVEVFFNYEHELTQALACVGLFLLTLVYLFSAYHLVPVRDALLDDDQV